MESDGHLIRVWELGNRSPEYPDYFADQAKNEQLATKIEDYSANVIYGLLQTPDYAAALFRATGPFWSEEEIDQKTVVRMGRAAILGDNDAATGVHLWAIVHEAALRTLVGGRETMRSQLGHLKSLMKARRIVLQVLPFSAGAHALTDGSVTIMEFSDLPTIAYVEGPNAGQVLANGDKIESLHLRYDLVRAAALSPQASLAFIDSVLKEYTS